MKRYEFYRNQKITVIDCRYFSFEAENLETAVQKIKELCADGQLDELSNCTGLMLFKAVFIRLLL